MYGEVKSEVKLKDEKRGNTSVRLLTVQLHRNAMACSVSPS